MDASYPPEGTVRLKQSMWPFRAIGKKRASILPPDDMASRPLIAVIAIMCYFAALAGESVLMINRAAAEWTTDLSRAVTVQVRPASGQDNAALEDQIEQLVDMLSATPGIVGVRALARREAEKLLEPWLGAGNIVDDLPVPRLIDVTFDPAQPPDFDVIQARIGEIAPNANLNDHSQWNDRILLFANFLRTLALAILILTVITTMAIVIFATRASLAAKHDIVEVLHLIGAHDSFIAREFEVRFLFLGMRAGIAAIAFAALTFVVLASLSSSLAQSAGVYFIPSIKVYMSDLLLLLLIPLGAALVAIITTRLTVLRVIGKIL